MQANQKMTRLKTEYETVFNGSQDALFLIEVFGDKQFRFVRTNLAHQQKTGTTLAMIAGKTPSELLGKEASEGVSINYQNCVSNQKSITYEETLHLPAGTRIWSTTFSPIFEEGRITHIVGSAIDITAQKELEKKLEYLARHDALTGLPNRMYLADYLDQIIDSLDKFTLMYLDLNGFKAINDTYGHLAGDEVLKVVAKRIQSANKEYDFACRLGGDEFVIIKHHESHRGNLLACVERLTNVISQPVEYND